jgi:hypothetical protein
LTDETERRYWPVLVWSSGEVQTRKCFCEHGERQ